MVFYVYFDPEVISVARTGGAYAVQSLISVLRGFTQNCCLFDFEDYRVSDALKSEVESLPEDFDRKIIKTLLAEFKKRNRFVYALAPHYASNQHDSVAVLQQAAAAFLDLLLLKEFHPPPALPNGIEIATLANYQHTVFEAERARLAVEGRTSAESALDEKDFLNQHFHKAMRHAARIEICDRIFGDRFADNYIYTTRTMFRWLGEILANPADCRLIFHCAKPDGNRNHHLLTHLGNFKRAHLANTQIEVQFYELPNVDNVLPHERFILTDQIALEIGRGMDFLNQKTARNRDVSVGYKSMKEVHDLLNSYSAGRLPIESV
jgi:hypothetical protein